MFEHGGGGGGGGLEPLRNYTNCGKTVSYMHAE